MELDRRDFLKAASILAGAVGLNGTGLGGISEALAAGTAMPRVIWLQAQSCTGCSVSLLNSIYYMTVGDLLTKTISLQYHPQLSAAAGNAAIAALQADKANPRYILVVEGAIPTAANGAYCTIWPGMTVLQAVQDFAANAAAVLAVGTCASFGGVAAAAPNPTAAKSVKAILGTSKPIVNLAGCPVSPDWIVGTVAYILQYNALPALDSNGRPVDFFRSTVHSNCPRRAYYDDGRIRQFGQYGCLRSMGCNGPTTHADCPFRRWNSPGPGTAGVNWCIGAGSPCQGCTEPNFPDGDSPFFAARGGGDD